MIRFPDLNIRKRESDEVPAFPEPAHGATHSEDGWRDITPARPAPPASSRPPAAASPDDSVSRRPRPSLFRDPLANPLLGLAVGVALFLALRAIYVDGAMPFLYRAFQ